MPAGALFARFATFARLTYERDERNRASQNGRPTRGFRPQTAHCAAGFSMWPPNSNRIADIILLAKSASPRELNRSYRARPQHVGRHAFVDGGLDRPAPFARIGDSARELFQVRILDERRGGQVQQPRRDHAAAPPNLAHVAQIEVELIMLGIAQRRRFGVDRMMLLADIGLLRIFMPSA